MILKDVLFKSIAKQVETEWKMGGLSDSIYYDYALEIARRYFSIKEETAMSVPLVPLFDKILLKRPEEMKESEGKYGKRILIPAIYREKAMNGKVISIGDGVKYVKKGQTIMFKKYAGTDVTFDDANQYLLISEQDVLGIMK